MSHMHLFQSLTLSQKSKSSMNSNWSKYYIIPEHLRWKGSTVIIKFQLLDLHRTAPRLPPQLWEQCPNTSWALAGLVLYPNRESWHSATCLTNCRIPHSKHLQPDRNKICLPWAVKSSWLSVETEQATHANTGGIPRASHTVPSAENGTSRKRKFYSVRLNPRKLREQPDVINW